MGIVALAGNDHENMNLICCCASACVQTPTEAGVITTGTTMEAGAVATTMAITEVRAKAICHPHSKISSSA